ncbi:hypothetical protein BO70DRAFT_409549 [Aspergillus heteromorphus CBS 117.55]|uniref:Uncharacterized protein n=1 Tax=Aspergillus heteromorphus CBS 117.55 TaxID=1448321 RepID=A0A317VTZ4_9EURO|nr:uncharacterized protein BO70DRAFT_409549 [Aspergillus heteromorphus CBS 117.55]PWY77059.1 hypothetical protein BO70DRAFT_409549 [Aspergillus heteromorphus CBS 117.55]
MSTEDPFAFIASEPAGEQKQAPKKPHWREKLFSKEKRSKGSTATDQQIEAFLGPTRSKSVTYGGSVNSPPRLDPGHRWPSAQDVINAHAPPPVDFTKPPFKSRRKGLKVKFSNRTPDVIGEGGDDLETPTMEISLCRNRAQSQGSDERVDLTHAEPKLPQLHLNTSFGDNNGHSSRGSRQQSNAQKGMNAEDWKPLLLQSSQDADFLMTLNLGDKGSRLSFRASPESNSFAQRIRDRMQAEEGRALHHRMQDPPSPADDMGAETPVEKVPDSPSSMYETPPISETDSIPPENPFRGPPLPQIRRSPEPETPVIPPVLSPGGYSQSLSPPKGLPIINGPQPDGSSRPSSRESRDTSRSPNPPPTRDACGPPKISLRSIANQIGNTAFADLKVYLTQFRDQIQASAESVDPVGISLAEWTRVAVWWFLRGKKRLEAYARSRPPSSEARSPQQSSTENAKQAIVDLGKALWINEQIVPKHDEVTRYGAMGTDAVLAVASTTGNTQLADLLSLHQTIMNILRSLAMSIKRNSILMTISSQGDSPIPVDISVWVQYPAFAADVAAVLSGASTRSLFADKSGKGHTFVQMMPLSDTNRYFSYGSMFVDVLISSPEDDAEQIPIPCALSIVRDRADWYVFAAISSQSELVNVVIQSDRKKGPTWESVEWQIRSHSMRVQMPRGFELEVTFQEEDFKNIWNIVQYTRKTEAGLQPESGETVVYETTLKSFHYMDPSASKAFPADPVERCRLRLFERSKTMTEGAGTRSQHQGFRLAVLTSPAVKTLSSVRHIIGHGAPIVFGLLRGEDGAPALLLKVKEDGKPRSMLMTFHDPEERTTIHSLLLGILPTSREVKSPGIPIRAYTIEQPADRVNGVPAKEHLLFPAGTVSIIDQEHTRVDHGYGQTVLSDHLRAFIATEWGSVTDRINLGPGDLKLGLEINNRTGLSLYRPGQKDLTVSVAENLVLPEMPDKLSEFLQTAMVKPMIRRFDFATVQDLHMFQRAVTGFKVLFDSVASSFSISRRRMVVPITKKWESSLARIQVIKRERVVQLVAFLNDFHHGRCLNFVLKGTDTLESFGKSGKFGVRIVDAKFALPKTDDDPSSQFVSLDTPEYPMEHDDISIAFDSEADRTKFQASVPGSVREPSRMSSLRR